MSKVFISFNYDDIDSKKAVENWEKQGMGTDIALSSWDGVSESAKGDEFVKKEIREKINEAEILLVLVGNDTHNRPWVDYEVNHALCHDKKIIWTQLPNTNGAPPRQLAGEKPIEFNLQKIQNAIRTP